MPEYAIRFSARHEEMPMLKAGPTLLAVLFMAACSGIGAAPEGATAGPAQVTGTVTTPQRIALARAAVATVSSWTSRLPTPARRCWASR
jgi:uncharacterized lipoprotein YbaY